MLPPLYRMTSEVLNRQASLKQQQPNCTVTVSSIGLAGTSYPPFMKSVGAVRYHVRMAFCELLELMKCFARLL
jgi:hypothetical protein